MAAAYELAHVTQRYGGDVVLHIEHLVIPAGTVTALVGPNGSGKSTLLDLLASVLMPASGEIHFFGERASESELARRRKEVGYLQQKPFLFNTTVAKNIELGLKLRRVPGVERTERIHQVSEEFGLTSLLGRRARELSGGEIQRVALAQTVAMVPRVLLLDEPFSHLDRDFRADLERLIRSVREGGEQTLVFSTHDQLQAQMLADEVCVLVDGQPVPTMFVNRFRGRVEPGSSEFDTGRLRIHVPSDVVAGERLTIESTNVVLSRHELESSMRNRFQGTIRTLTEEGGSIHVVVDCGELIHVMVTPEAWRDLSVNIGHEVWVSFKSTAVHVF